MAFLHHNKDKRYILSIQAHKKDRRQPRKQDNFLSLHPITSDRLKTRGLLPSGALSRTRSYESRFITRSITRRKKQTHYKIKHSKDVFSFHIRDTSVQSLPPHVKGYNIRT